jgi:hypothetical protein
MTTVREAKKVKMNLEEALASAAEFLERHPEHSALAAEAKMGAARMMATNPQGKEADQADAGAIESLRAAAKVGRTVLSSTDAGRKVPRLTSRIEEAERLLGPG